MKKVIPFFIFLTLHLFSHAQGGTWTWVKGGDTLNSPGHRGTKGVPDLADYPSGRYQAAQWIDLNGNFWIFGGVDDAGTYNDLWMYNPVTNIWTWVNGPSTVNDPGTSGTIGVPGPNYCPCSRSWGSITWTDQQGRLWLYAGLASGGGTLSDMWMYDIPSNEWTLIKDAGWQSFYGTMQVSDSNNSPGARWESNVAWVRSDGTLWTFGANGNATAGYENDMWKFDISTNNWTWMSGDSTGLSWNYGTKNLESPLNLPVACSPYTHWQDINDNFYTFSGLQYVPDSPALGLGTNVVWRYNTNNNQWTWISGDSSLNDTSVYIQQCLAGHGAVPSSRYEHRSAQMNNCSDLLWTFGGNYNWNMMGDLWVFNTQTKEWTWISGTDTLNSTGNYGIINVPAPSNEPPARAGECFWADRSGRLWVWGGSNSFNVTARLSDMWKFEPDSSCTPNSVSVPTIRQNGKILTSSPAAHYQWQLNGINMVNDTTASITVTQNGTYTVVVTNTSGCCTATSINITATGINDFSDTNGINIYPNPATQSCTVYISNYGGESYTASLSDMTGNEVSGTMSFVGSSFTFPLSQYASGIYILKIMDSYHRQVLTKLVIE